MDRENSERTAAEDPDAEKLRHNLSLALASGSKSEVRSLVRRGAPLLAKYDLDEFAKDKGTALDLAVLASRHALALEFFELSPKCAHELSRKSVRALAWAARDGKHTLVETMLNFGAGAGAGRDAEGRSALLLAATRGCRECAMLLLRAGAWSSEPAPEEVSRWAIQWKMAKAFEDLGAIVGVQASPKLGSAVDSREMPWLLKKVRPDRPLSPIRRQIPNPGANPIHVHRTQDDVRKRLLAAIRKEDEAEILALVRKGATLLPRYHHPGYNLEIGAGPGELVHPVDWAALDIRFKSAVCLLGLSDLAVAFERDVGGSENVPVTLARDCKYAVYLAARHGHPGLLHALLERGGNVGQVVHGESALLAAVRFRWEPCARMLLHAGAWECEGQPHDVLRHAREAKIHCVLEVAAGWDGPLVARPVSGRTATSDRELVQGNVRLNLEGVKKDLERPTTPATTAGLSAWTPETSASRPWSSRRWPPSSPGRHAAGTGLAAVSQLRVGPSTASDLGWSQLNAGTTHPADTNLSWRHLTTEETRLRSELAIAIRKNDTKLVRSITLRGAPLDAAFDLGFGERGNCVDWACVCSRPAIALELLQLAGHQGGGLAEHLATTARAAFFWSASQGHLAVLKELLRLGADVAQPCRVWSPSESALALAVFGLRQEEVRLLLEHGAWQFEPEWRQLEISKWAQSRPPIVYAFRMAGVEMLPTK